MKSNQKKITGRGGRGRGPPRDVGDYNGPILRLENPMRLQRLAPPREEYGGRGGGRGRGGDMESRGRGGRGGGRGRGRSDDSSDGRGRGRGRGGAGRFSSGGDSGGEGGDDSGKKTLFHRESICIHLELTSVLLLSLTFCL